MFLKNGRPYGLRFPVITVGDWVRLQERLISYLGIKRLRAVAGGSLGGQQALEWALAYPDRVEAAIIIASANRLSDQGLAFNAVARHAITTDPNFQDGNYYNAPAPSRGLAVARMLGHITYLSEASMHRKFGRRYRSGDRPGFHLGADFEVEGYLQHQGESFVERFDANSYLYLTRAMDYYDAADWGEGYLDQACRRIDSRLLLVSFSSDWLYPPEQLKKLALALGTPNIHLFTAIDFLDWTRANRIKIERGLAWVDGVIIPFNETDAARASEVLFVVSRHYRKRS